MPAPNDLTEEEEKLFVEHGQQPAGPGKEPIIESDADVQQRPTDDGGEQEPPVVTQQERLRRADGTFMSKEEIAALPPEQQPPAEGGQPKFVPHEALHAERQRASEAIRRAQIAETRMNALLTARQAGAEPPPLPDLSENPVEYIQALEHRLSAFEQERNQELETRQIDQAINQDEELFKQNVPDYDQASHHYVQSRAAELLQFYTAPDAMRMMMDEARQIAREAWNRGTSVGQMVYSLAQARGYVPGNTAADPTKSPIPARAGPTAQDVVAGIKQGQQASKSLSGGAGGGGAAVLNAEAVLAMSDEEFEEYIHLGQKDANQRFASIG